MNAKHHKLTRWLAAGCLISALSASGSWVWADRITLKNGRVMEGKVTEDGSEVVIVTDAGITVRLPADRVQSIVKAKTPAEIYAERKGKAKTTAEHRALARYCKAHKLKQAKDHWQQVLSASPNDREARREMGFVWNGKEWQTRDAYMRELGLVRYGGRWVSELEKELLEAAADAKKYKSSKVRRLIREAVKHKREARREKAKEKLAKVPTEKLYKPFRRTLMLSSRPEREYILKQIAGRKTDKKFHPLLSRTALADPSRKLRKAALDTLEGKKDPDSALYFVKALGAESPILRINAASALMRFPDRRVVSTLIRTLRYESGDFGRAHWAQITQRAYIQDFELSSGGTGLAVAEVADPVVGGFTSGVVLDVHIKKVEWESKAQVLTYITGQDYGTDQVAWANWYKKNKDQFVLSPKAKKQRDMFATKK